MQSSRGGLLEVITVDGELLWALFGGEDIHHLAKADHMHRHRSRAATVDVGHVWKEQLLTLHATCAHSFASDLSTLIACPRIVCIDLTVLTASPGIVCTNFILCSLRPMMSSCAQCVSWDCA